MCDDAEPSQPPVPEVVLPVHTISPALYQIVDTINADLGLAGNIRPSQIEGGAESAAGMNDLIYQAVEIKGVFADGWFSVDDVRAINRYLQDNYKSQWVELHGDDEGDGEETGFHRVQNDGATTQFRDQNFVNTVADGIYHLGFAIQNGHLLNEDGNENASLQDVARWLNALYTDRSTSETGLDRIVDLIIADPGLANSIPDRQIFAGASAANELNLLIKQAIADTHVADDHWINDADLVLINDYVRANYQDQWTLLHGDDEDGTETGFHKVQNDGATTKLFGKNLVNTVADGIYHIGFEIQNGRFLNEDGNPNATVEDAASWINYFYTDLSTSNTGLDRLVDIIKEDRGLARNTSAADINDGARSADRMNNLIAEAIETTNAVGDGWFTADDVRAINGYLQANYQSLWVELHGDDEDGEETGFHKVQNDGANTTFFGKNLVNTIADGIYHLGFSIDETGKRLLNEDHNPNATLTDVADWLNFFYSGVWLVYGTGNSERLEGTDEAEELIGRGGDDCIVAGGGDDLIVAGSGNDIANGGKGDDVYLVSGNRESGFEGYDVYKDEGGEDTILTVGTKVDIGVKSFTPANGIDTIDASSATEGARLLGDGSANVLDLSGVVTIEGDLTIAGAGGDDKIIGTVHDDIVSGGTGSDTVDGGAGNDCFLVSGNTAKGFEGYDTYQDSSGDHDTIKTVGERVDIGVKSFGLSSGIEIIDASASTAGARLLGDGQGNVLDLSGVATIEGDLTIAGAGGDDKIIGTLNDDSISGGPGSDTVDGGGGNDCFLVSGNTAKGFEGYDTYQDSSGDHDTIKTVGERVDIGVKSFGPSSGIEIIDTSVSTAGARLLGDGQSNILDLSGVTSIIGGLAIDGGGGDDAITGSAGSETVVGGGGHDLLIGGDGPDQFRYAKPSEGGDQIAGFVHDSDELAFVGAAFGGLPVGPLAADRFVVGTGALDGNDRFIFNPATHQLLYDANGSSKGGATLVAWLVGVDTLDASDLLIV